MEPRHSRKQYKLRMPHQLPHSRLQRVHRCGLVVSRVLSFKSDDPYSNPVAGRIICLMEENMTKSPGVPLLIGSILEL